MIGSDAALTAIYQDSIVVGAAVGDGENNYGSGSAHVFVWSGEEWKHQVMLLAPDGGPPDWFGGNVAIYQDSIVVDGDNGDYSGSTHVFVV